MSVASVTNPVSTGGGGTFFEQHVDALFLALLLVRAPLPVLKDCQIEKVHFQAEHLDWKTDDVLVVAVRPDGVYRRLAIQVKRQFKISENDEICKKAFGDFWADFVSTKFDPTTDRFALATLRGTNILLNDFNSLLDCARASVDVADFVHRLNVDGFLSKKARGHAKAIRRILEAINPELTDEQVWSFLSLLHVVSFDLNTSSAQNEVWIKTLLAATANGSDTFKASEASWLELLELAGAGMPTAKSYRYPDLPQNLRDRHGPIATRSVEIIRALSDHCSITLNGINSTIYSSVKIARDALISQLLEAIGENQVVLITAPAGLGKSVLAKDCVELLGRDLYCLAFRAEEFAVSHIDETLQQAQVPANGTLLMGLLAGQGRKLVLIESVERLLEASVRGAFADLLYFAQRDNSLGLLITCRDYSLETVTSALLDQARLPFKVIQVPLLLDEELEQVVAAVPHLANAFQHTGLKRLLRSPYLLDKAAQMDWSDTEELPTNEMEFRRRCWREVIRHNAAAADGMPDRREHVFIEVALRRARQLRPFIDVEDLDPGALQALRNDGLIVVSPEVGSMAAPSHDVLEDWAIIQWLSRRWILHEGAAGLLEEDIGGYPAVRRAYRKWFSELLRGETLAATDFVLAVFRDGTLPSYFRDDTIVCTLQSPSAKEFLERHREALLESSGLMLGRVIHLMRVACKTTPWWLPGFTNGPSQVLVASGKAWPAMLELVFGALDRLLPEHVSIILGLIEDFANSIDWSNPEPKGFEEAAKIGFRLLAQLNGYQMDDMQKRALRVIAKVPRGDQSAFKALLNRAIAGENQDRFAEDVSEIFLDKFEGWTACRYFPEEIIRLMKSKILLFEKDFATDDWLYEPSIDIEPYFGIQENTKLEWFPASSIHGVFFPLLRFHPQLGLDFIIEILNHAGNWYGEQRWPHKHVEPAHQITIEVPGDAPVIQWANLRLWGLYRGHQVGPYVLQTALMALESWLLEISGLKDLDVEPWLLKLIRESNNVMATAVVASVCNAHPEKAGRAGLALLSSCELIRMDRIRFAQEQQHFAMSGIFPVFGINEIYDDERKNSDALPHRRHDLEALALKLQFGEGREQVFELIDRHRAALPPIETQSEEHRLWRLALHRMDLRGLNAVEKPTLEACDEDAEGVSQGEESQKRLIEFVPSKIESDVQALVEQHAPIAAQQERELLLLNWGNAAWERRDASRLDIRDWETFLALARARNAEPEPEDYMRGGPGVIAAVCARDHWDKMSPDDRAWCIHKLVWEVERDCDTKNHITKVGRSAHQPDRRAAYILPSLLSRDVSEEQATQIREAMAKALTHSVEEVVMHAAEGIGNASTGKMRDYSEACIAAIARRARLISDRLAENRKRPYEERMPTDEIIRKASLGVRAEITTRTFDTQAELEKLNIDHWPGTQAAEYIMHMLGHASDSALAIEFHRRVANSIVENWEQDIKDRTRRANYDFISKCLQLVARFVLRLKKEQALHVCEQLLVAVAIYPRGAAQFVRDLVVEADWSDESDSFWVVWQSFANAICAAPWIERLESHSSYGKELVDAIFLRIRWKDNIRHWRRLEGQGHRVDELAKRFSGVAAVFDAYCQFLYDIGETSLPKAFVLLAESIEASDPTAMLAKQDTLFFTESLLRRQVYAEPHRLKSDPKVRTAVLAILDHLIEAGSSAAYRMRDDFVTPLRG